jgi:protein tyrosine phosphatase (PTP) superfamily phosphohydrolase (DUF442 family)
MKDVNRKVRLAAALLGIFSFVRPGLAASETIETLKSADWAGAAGPAFARVDAAKRESLVEARAAAAAQSLPNFAQVSAGLFRSGQPTQQGVASLPAKGIKTILKLNADSPAEADWAASAGLAIVTQVMSNVSSPSYAEVDAALAVINDPARQPVLVHCHKGSDRTGTVVAAYRVVVQGMSVDQAVAEAKSFGYGAPGFDNLTTWLNGYLAARAGK